MMRGRRVLAVVLVFCMVMGLVVCPVGKEKVQAAEFESYEYESLDSDTVIITKYNGSDQVLVVPETIESKRVVSLAEEAFKNCDVLTTISLPAGLTGIGNRAFEDCTALTEISLPAGLTSMGTEVFRGCTALTKASLPDGLTSIGDSSFYACTNLAEISFPSNLASIGESAFLSCRSITKISLPEGLTSIGKGAFSSCDKLTEISIPEGLISIGEQAFQYCSSLTDVYYSGLKEQWDQVQIEPNGNNELLGAQIHYSDDILNDYDYKILSNDTIEITKYKGSDTEAEIPAEIENRRVTSIGEQAFGECGNLTKISCPNGVTNIGEYAFRNCSKLTAIDLSSGLASIGNGAFFDCGNLAQINIPSGVTNIGESAFSGCRSLAGISIPNGVTSIGAATFSGCENLSAVSLPSGIKSIGSLAFSDCYSLSGISLPDSLTGIGDNAFEGCRRLAKIDIPAGVTSIGKTAFHNCAGLTEINLPTGITDIGEQVFRNCTGLTKVELPDGVTGIGEMAFAGCTGLTEIHIPNSMASIKQSAFQQCSSLKDVYYSGLREQWDKITISTVNNEALLNAQIHCDLIPDDPAEDYDYETLEDGTIEITAYKGSDAKVKVPDQIDGKKVTSIGFDAFINKDSLTEITIPSGITRLGASSNPDLREGFFRNCPNLKWIYVDDGNEYFLAEEGVLFNKQKTELIKCPQAKQGEYVIPSSVTKIGNGAFCDCGNLTKITVPPGVNSIGYTAFCRCGRLLAITIPDGVTLIDEFTFGGCVNLTEITIPDGVTSIGYASLGDCRSLASVAMPQSVKKIDGFAFNGCSSLKDVYYSGTKEQWDQIDIASDNEELLHAEIHYKENPEPVPDEAETILPETVDAKEELERLKAGDQLSLEKDFQHYLTNEQIDLVESSLYIWLAEINYAYKYSGNSGVKERIMKKAGIDPQGDFISGTEQAITHISVETKYGPKTFEVTLNLGKPDDSNNLYPAYGIMHYEVLEKEGIASDVPMSGRIGKESYADMGVFIDCVSRASEDSLHNTYQWQSLSDEMIAGILMDKTATEIIGNKNGSFSTGTFILYEETLAAYSKKVTISCPVDVSVYSMDGEEVGSIVNNKPSGGNQNVRLDVNGESKSVYLTNNDYYLGLRGTDTGTMKYEVEEIVNKDVRRNVQYLELQLKEDMQYEGYVFRALNIDSDLYELRTKGGSSRETFYADEDKYYETLSLFRRIQGLSLSQKNTSLDADKTVQLNASLYPLNVSNPNLQWTTDSASIARVDSNGLVTAVGAGRATVTVSTKDGSFLKQYCIIDVADKIVDVPGGNTGGSSGSSSGGSSGGSSGNSGGSSVPVEQEKTPVVVKLHYVLQFHANGGTGLSRRTMTLLAEDSPGIMPKVKRKDYLFSGWYTQQDGGTKVAGDKPLKEAMTLYAQWTKASAPAKAAAPTLKSGKKGQMQVSFKSVTGAAGYQIEYSVSKKFTSAKTKDAGASAKKKTISALKAGKKYYVRLRAYSVDSMKNRIYGAYSTVKSVKVKG